MQRIKIALAVIQQGDDYLLQFRNGGVQIGAAGLIGCFGGKINDNESSLVAVVREVAEETTLVTDPIDWVRIGEVTVESDYKHEPVRVSGEVYYYKLSEDSNIEATEGKLVRLSHDDIFRRFEELTPATKDLFQKFYKDKK